VSVPRLELTIVRASLVLLMGLVLAGCGAPRGEGFRPEVADPSKGVVYVFREPRTLGGRPVSVYINQELEADLQTGQYLARVVPPGEYFVRAEDGGSAVRQARVNAGDAVYFRVRAGRFGRSVSVDIPEADYGRRLIARSTRIPE
jgi:hypothetical protein